MKQRKTEEGTEQVVEEFEVYRPIVLANIWGMENVLGDRCITLILEKSSKKEIINLMEIFKEEKIVKSTVELLNECSLCSFLFSGKVYKEWNNYVKSSNNNYTNYTNNTNNTNYTNYTKPFEKIRKMDLNGRELELSFPLCLIASEISEEITTLTTLTLKSIFQQKKAEDLIDNYDSSLYDFVSQEVEIQYIKVNEITRKFKEFLQSDEDWINSKWVGRALKRLNLIKEKRRMGRGTEIILDIKKAQKQIKIFR